MGGEVIPALLLGLLILLTSCFVQLAVGEKGSVCEMGLVLELDPVLGFVVPHCMLEDHDVQCHLGFVMGRTCNC